MAAKIAELDIGLLLSVLAYCFDYMYDLRGEQGICLISQNAHQSGLSDTLLSMMLASSMY